MTANKKSVPKLNQNDLEEIEKNNSVVEKSTFEQISKLFSSGANNIQNQQESEQQLLNNSSKVKSSLIQQRLVEIQNLNPNTKYNNSTPVSKVPFPSCNGLSNSKILSTAQTNVSLSKSDIKPKSQQFIYKSSSNSEIKGYSILSAQKNANNTPTAAFNENDSHQASSNKKDYATIFSSVFPQPTSKVLSPPEKKLTLLNLGNNTTNSIVRQSSKIQEQIPEQSKNLIGNSLIRQQQINQNSKSLDMQTRSDIKKIGGDLSPINKTINNQDNFILAAQEIIQENGIQWLNPKDEDDFIDRGQDLPFKRKDIDDQFEIGMHFNEELNEKQCINESLDKEGQNDYVCGQQDLENKDNDYEEQDSDTQEDYKLDENRDHEKENQNFIGIRRQNQRIVNDQSKENSIYENKKEKRLKKKELKKLKKLRLQHQQMIEQQQQQIKLKQLESDLRDNQLNTEKDKVIIQEQPTTKGFQYSNYSPVDKNQQQQQLKNEVKGIKQLQKQLSDSKNKKELSFQNLLSSLKQKSSNSEIQQLSQQQNLQQFKAQNKNTNGPASNSSAYFDGNTSPSLSTFSNSEDHFKTKKKLKTNNVSNLEDQSCSTIQNTPIIGTAFNIIKQPQNNYNIPHNSQYSSTIKNNSLQVSQIKSDQIQKPLVYQSQVFGSMSGTNQIEGSQQRDMNQLLNITQGPIKRFQQSLFIKQDGNQQIKSDQQDRNQPNKQDNSQTIQHENFQANRQNNIQFVKQENNLVFNNQNKQQYNYPNHNNNYNYTQKNTFNHEQNIYNYQLNNTTQNQQNVINYNQQTIFNINQQPIINQNELNQVFNNNSANSSKNQQGRYFGTRQQQQGIEFSQNQPFISQSTIQSSQESYQVPTQSQQSQIIARQNSLVRQKNSQDQYCEQKNNNQNYNEIMSPEEDAIFYNNKTIFEQKLQKNTFQQVSTTGLSPSFNKYSNPYQQYQSNNQTLEKSRQIQNSSSIKKSIDKGNSQIQINNKVKCTPEQIQEQIGFTNQLKDQLERKMREEQLNSLKYQQCSSTKRLKFQILNDDEQQNETYPYQQNYSFIPNQLYQNRKINEKYQQNDSMVSPNLENEINSRFEDVSPILYSPGVQFSPADSDQEICKI